MSTFVIIKSGTIETDNRISKNVATPFARTRTRSWVNAAEGARFRLADKRTWHTVIMERYSLNINTP